MIENTQSSAAEKRELGGFAVEALSIGRLHKNPERNEDGFVATSHTFAVIDGSAPRTDVKFLGSSSAQFATNVLKDVFKSTPSSLNGIELVNAITARINEEVAKVEGAQEILAKKPEARPAALFTAARIHDNKLVVTAVGDVRFRVNGNLIHQDHILSEDLMIQKRVAAMEKAQADNKELSDDELRTLGRAAIDQDLKTQAGKYFNNPDDPLGLGIVDGTPVPAKFIKVYEFDIDSVETLEIFSDGYYVVPEEASVDAFESAFVQAEKEDPLRWKKYPAVKTSAPDQFSDDQTVLIAKKLAV